MTDVVDPSLLFAWLEGRSISRGLPAPVHDHGGFRVDTNDDSEVRRWVFAEVSDGLIELGRTIRLPKHPIKLCGTAAELSAALPEGWRLHPPAWFMTTDAPWSAPPLPPGYAFDERRDGAVTLVRIVTARGEQAARGYAAETASAFVYDRIVTEAAHRRKGLGAALMRRLLDTKRDSSIPDLLTATEDGRALYTALGWRTISPYVTASIGGAEQPT